MTIPNKQALFTRQFHNSMLDNFNVMSKTNFNVTLQTLLSCELYYKLHNVKKSLF